MSKKQHNTINITFTDDLYKRLMSLVEKTKVKNKEDVILSALRLYEFIVNEAENNPDGELIKVLTGIANPQPIIKMDCYITLVK